MDHNQIDQMYQRWRLLQNQYDGRRVMLVRYTDWPEMNGTTGRIRESEDCLILTLDQPFPAWAYEFEDARSGKLAFDSDDHLQIISESHPIHNGQPLSSGKA